MKYVMMFLSIKSIYYLFIKKIKAKVISKQTAGCAIEYLFLQITGMRSMASM